MEHALELELSEVESIYTSGTLVIWGCAANRIAPPPPPAGQLRVRVLTTRNVLEKFIRSPLVSVQWRMSEPGISFSPCQW
jgi:hypothetical protein